MLGGEGWGFPSQHGLMHRGLSFSPLLGNREGSTQLKWLW